MLKKRVIFTLLFDSGNFMLSRNFRLQKVGNLLWLQNNYKFSKIAVSIDELLVLDVSRGSRNFENFCDQLKALTEGCFIPIAAGGGVRSVDQGRALLRSGADKIVLNTPLFESPALTESLAIEFGEQCLVGAMDVKRTDNGAYQVWIENGTRCLPGTLHERLLQIGEEPLGEIYLNSIDRDGTGQGYDFGMLEELPRAFSKPIILAGGVGHGRHLAQGLADDRVDAVATAHLFNFVGDGLVKARQTLLNEGLNLARWDLGAGLG